MRFYRALLRLYPSSHRAEYGSEMEHVFAARRGGETGWIAGLSSIALAIADVVPNAVAAHWDILARDLKYAVRALRRTPGFALTSVLVVALGVGANAAAFSVANFVLLRPLPFAAPDRLVRLWQTTPGYSRMELSGPNFRDWKAGARSYSALGAFTTYAMNLTGSGEPRRVDIGMLSWDVPEILGVHALIGRTFTSADSATRAVLLGYDLWQTQFGGDRNVVGRTVDLDGSPYSIVGVMPSEFRFPSRDEQLWTTMPFAGSDFEDRTDNFLYAVGRLKPGVTVEQAGAELRGIAARLERQYPKEDEKTSGVVVRMSDDFASRNRLLLYALCGAALCTLLLACANLANLLLVRAISREREIAVRTALGAGRDRLVRQLVTESVLLVGAGAAVGVMVAVETVPTLARLVPLTLPIADQPTLDWRTLVVATLTIAVIGVAFGVIPALRGTGNRGGLDALRDGARSGGRRQGMRSVLVMIEVAASVVLLMSSGLLMRAMWRLQSLDPGFRADSVLTLRTALASNRYGDPLVRDRFYTEVLSAVRALPGVSSAAYISGLPMVMRGAIWPVTVRDRESIRDAANSASLRYVTPNYFATMDIPLRRGRDLEPTDDATHPMVAIVSESFAQRYWPNEDPLGKHFEFAFRDRMIVGVVGNVRVRGFEIASEPQVYLPPKQIGTDTLFAYSPKDLVVRSKLPASALMPQIRRVIHAADPLQPISNVQMLDDLVASDTASRGSQLRVLEILAAIALLLATVGIHGLLSFTVSRRAREIGVRVALGAKPGSILSKFLIEGVLLGLGGAVPGVAVAYLAGRAMQALLVGIAPSDPVTLGASVALCAAATVLGCLRPALRASRTDPILALRSE